MNLAMRNTPQVRIRRASLEDVDDAMDLSARLDELQLGWRLFEPRDGTRAQTRERYARLVTGTDGLVVLAHADGHLIGLGLGEVRQPSSRSDQQALEIGNVYIEPGFRRRGIGRAIVAELAAFASEQHLERLVLRVFAANQQAITFWATLGFAPRLIQFTAPTSQVEHGTISKMA